MVEVSAARGCGPADRRRGDARRPRSRDRRHSHRIPPGGRLHEPHGGGALLDFGVYPIGLASQLLGQPTGIDASGILSERGVDLAAAIALRHANGALAAITTSILGRGSLAATIVGTEGTLELAPPFFLPTSLTLRGPAFDSPGVNWVGPAGLRGHEGLGLQATALAEYVARGLSESPLHPLDETIAVLRTIDEARRILKMAASA